MYKKIPILFGRDGATSKRVTKIGWRQTGRPRSLLITSTTTCLRIFRKIFAWFFNILLSAFLCKPDSSLSSSMIWINPKRIHEQMPISIIVSFSVGSTHSEPINCTHLKVFWCMGSPGIFSGVEGKTRRTLLCFDLELHLRSAQPHPIHPRRVQRLPPTVFRPN